MSTFLDLLWPYLVLVLVGFLPNETWRVLGLVAARGLDQNSEILVWVRAVATAILAAIIARLVIFSPGALGGVPLTVRLSAIVIGFLGFWFIRRSVLAGVMSGVAALILGGLIAGR
jgi:hypothetical protein